MFRFSLTAIFLTLFCFDVGAKEIAGIEMPDTLKAGDETLQLNGVGLRKKLFIKVYAGGLYLTAPESNAQKIILENKSMAVRMHFIYNGVSAEKLIEAWNEGFGHATNDNTAPIQKEIDAFNALFTSEAKKNDVYEVIYVQDKGVEVYFNGQLKGTIEPSIAFKRALFGIWLCDIPADENLKKGMLGG